MYFIINSMINIEKKQKETNHDYALRVIRENIINLQLKPGSMISEQDIANELSLSRTPVHEALQELAHTKIIQILPQRGSLVSLIDMNLIDEAVFLRTTVEAAVFREACKLATENDLTELEENLNLQEFYLGKNNLEKFMELDNGFHEIIYRVANKMQCLYMVRTMIIHHDRYRELRLHTSEPTPIFNEHKEIFNALKDKQVDKVEQLLYKHLTRRDTDAKEIMEKYPEYFASNNL